MIGAESCCSLQLPDDVKQNIEDAGARYIPYVTNPPEFTQHAYLIKCRRDGTADDDDTG